MTDSVENAEREPEPPDSGIGRLLEIMARLRSPEGGCPWDLKQTYASIVPYTIEEAYEVADAIERGAMEELREELGDLLFQVVFYSQLAREEDHFDFASVVSTICEKMVRRHPHVFAETSFSDSSELRTAWDRQKSQERKAKGTTGLLDGIPRSLPALVRAEKIQRRASRVGFDWTEPRGVIRKIREELAEIEEELNDGKNSPGLATEIGDLLFSCVNLARHCHVDAEHALRSGNRKFERRFRHIEERLGETGRSLEAATPEALESLWEEAKQRERGLAGDTDGDAPPVD